VKPDGTAFTTQNTGEGDAVDSDADVTTGRVSITAPASGSNRTEPGEADDPTIDAGLVSYDLTITKERLGDEKVLSGATVTFTLTPRNDGPSDVLAGWTVADQLPTGLTLVSMTGEGYTCVDVHGIRCSRRGRGRADHRDRQGGCGRDRHAPERGRGGAVDDGCAGAQPEQQHR
jgi:uncharacterized repeat protein (TIGR01451 family)